MAKGKGKKKGKKKKSSNNSSKPSISSALAIPPKQEVDSPKKTFISESYSDLEIEFSQEDIPPEISPIFRKRRIIAALLIICILILGYVFKAELTNSNLQAKYFHKVSSALSVELNKGEGEVFVSPNGPFDIRLGYSKLNSFKPVLHDNGFLQESFAKVSEEANWLSKYGINFPYKEKQIAGLEILGDKEKQLYKFTEPSWVFPNFDSISKIIVNTLLFIEDRTVLQSENPLKNPAVEWDRFIKAIIDLFASKLIGDRDVPGGSTLATQIEKFKHSDGGRTSAATDKLRQMYSASLRAYHESQNTLEARKDIVLDYINSVPLAALKGFGEIHGLGDGLWAYFAEDPKRVNEILNEDISEDDEVKLKNQALAYRKVLSLFLAHRRPSDYLDDHPEDLQLQVDTYLPLLFKEGVIPYSLFKASLGSKISHRRVLPSLESVHFSSRKGPNVVRNHLLTSLGLTSLYELDRLDLSAKSTINVGVQEEISRSLLKLTSRDEIKKLGLDGFRLLSTGADPKKVIYSFTLFENQNGYNKLRVQTDTFDQPLNINEGVKLDLGSTSKFRTIITYLEVVEEIYYRFHSAKDLKTEISKQEKDVSQKDPISRWGQEWLKANPSQSLMEMLEAALDRQYSASTSESFFTAGGLHHFENFNKGDDGKVLPIRMALRHSVNLPFIRLMRDLVRYYTYHTEGSSALTLVNMNEDTRSSYLKKFADQEGKVFLRRFYEKYQK